MKIWSLWNWANNHLKTKDGKLVRCFRNKLLFHIMDLSGVKLCDINRTTNHDK